MKARRAKPTSFIRTELLARLALAALLPVSIAGCGGTGGTVSPTAPSSTSVATAPPATTSPGPTPTASPSLVDLLTAALQDEYHAQAVYQGVLNDLGNVMPFANIVRAEESHANAIVRLFAARGMPAPASAWTPANVPHFAGLAAACAAAAEAEVANLALYDRSLETDLPTDVRTVFTNNRAASVNNHLPAFSRCR